MANHDNYDKDILKALQKIANSLEKIEKKMPDRPQTMNELRESIGLPRINNDEEFLRRIVNGEDTLPNNALC